MKHMPTRNSGGTMPINLQLRLNNQRCPYAKPFKFYKFSLFTDPTFPSLPSLLNTNKEKITPKISSHPNYSKSSLMPITLINQITMQETN